jgi:hypothetical protein
VIGPVQFDPALFTLIIQFEVDAESGESFVRALTAAVEKSIVTLPGFRASTFQLSGDGSRVINYAQWQSAEVYDESMSDADSSAVQEVIQSFGARVVHSDSYSIVATYAANRA